MTYTNPITLRHGSERANAGDPFVLKYNGYYYLYVSTEANETGIRCYKSKDLINWEFQKLVCDDAITLNAYAPEVIFFKDKFYLATSPSGNGHYIYTSKHPLGPFERVTNNLGQMIDGSFYKENGKLYFLRANHFGITIHEVTKDYQLINRVDLDAEMNGWTEGPFLIKREGIYYMTYCGNNLFSDTYRVDYSYSKHLLGPYIKGINNALLNKLNSQYDCLGHSAMIKGPNLYDYYNVYHKLTKIDNGSIRDYCIDRLDFNQEVLKQNITDQPQLYPPRPTFESYDHKDFKQMNGYYLSNEETANEYILELNILGSDLEIVFGYQTDHYYQLSGNRGLYVLKEIIGHTSHIVARFNLDLFDDCITKIDIKQTNTLEIYINDDLIKSLDISTQGKIGVENLVNLGYVAYNNLNFNASRGIQTLPNVVFSNESKYTIKQDDVLTFDVSGNGDYCVSGYMKIIEPLTLKLNDTLIQLKQNDSPYEFNNEIFSTLNISKETKVKLQVIEGAAVFKYLVFEPLTLENMNRLKPDNLFDETIQLHQIKSYSNYFKTKLEIIERNFRSRFGMLVNITNYSDYKFQAQYPFNGYFIGFNQDLLVVDRVNFGVKRVFDVPYKPKDTTCVIEAKFKRNKISVYVDGELIIECFDQHIKNTGYLGTYSNELSNILFLDTEGGILND